MKDVIGTGNFFAKECDVTKESNVIETFDYIKATLGTVHVLINNAGMVKVKTIEGKENHE